MVVSPYYSKNQGTKDIYNMTFEEFVSSLQNQTEPARLPNLLQALWYDGKGKWDIAHKIAQSVFDENGSWIHAYLHRKEGDLANASYWYSNAGKELPQISLVDEWTQITKKLLSQL